MAKVIRKRALSPSPISFLFSPEESGILRRRVKEKLRISKGMLVNIPATHAAWKMLIRRGVDSFHFFSNCSAVTQRVLGDACERDGEYLLFLLTIRGSCELD